MRNIKLYLDLLRLDALARLHYRADFLTGLVTALVQHGSWIALIWLVFRQISALGDWNVSEITFLYAVFSLISGLTTLAAGGLRNLGSLVWQGELDTVLVLPVHPLIQLFPRFNVDALGNTLVSIAMLAVASTAAGVVWDGRALAGLTVAVVSGTGISLGILIAANALAFWAPYPSLVYSLEQVATLGRYPALIYPTWMKRLVTWVLPLAFAAYYPTAVILGKDLVPFWVAPASLPVSLLTLMVGLWVWRCGLRKYEGVGS